MDVRGREATTGPLGTGAAISVGMAMGARWMAAYFNRRAISCSDYDTYAIPTLDRIRYAPAAGVARGGYVVADPEGGDPEVILVATGSEVHVALSGLAR